MSLSDGLADLRIAEQEDKRWKEVVEVADAVFHDHVLEDRVVGVEGHLGPDQAGEVGGEAEEGEQGEAEEVLALPQCEVWSKYLQGFSCTYCSDKGWLLHIKKTVWP